MLTGSATKLRRASELNLYINRLRLENVNEHLYLGVLLDSSLKLNAHISMTYDKYVSKLGLIAKTRHLFDKTTARLLHLTTILPIIDYCSSVYMFGNQTELEKLQKLQNVALRMVAKRDYHCPIT